MTRDDMIGIVHALHNCFISQNVADRNMEPANAVDVIDRVAANLGDIASAITPVGALAMPVPGGGKVGSLTEAVIYAAENLAKIADAIGDLASAVREQGDSNDPR